MASICLLLHVHQPYALRHYSVFDRGVHYFDAYKIRDACRRYALRSIMPMNRILLGLLRRGGGRFRFSCALTGSALDLFRRHYPEVIDSFAELYATGCVEFLGTPYHHALGPLYSPSAFAEQVEMHRARLERLFGAAPRVFRNSELLYGDDVADAVAPLGFAGVVCDGDYESLAGRACSRVYAGGQEQVPLLLRNARLSRDVAERFADRSWDQWPLTAPRYAEWLARFEHDEELVTLGWDYATFGLHHGEDTGILEFFKHLPEKILAYPHLSFVTASEALARHPVVDTYRPAHLTSSAEKGGNLSPWLGNPMQSHATHRLFALEEAVRNAGDDAVREDWRRLQACENFEAMSTAPSASPPVGGWLAAPASPYDAYINFMNILDSLSERVGAPVTS